MNGLVLLILAIVWAVLYFAARQLRAKESSSVTHHSSLVTCHSSFITEVIGVSGLLALVTVGFFWQILLTSNSWMPAGGGDLAPFLYPNYRFAAEHLRQGVIPLWNPHLYSGAPFAADIQSGLFYPINLLLFLLVPNLTYEWLEHLAIFHFWLAGTNIYVCLRLLIPFNKSQQIQLSRSQHPQMRRRSASKDDSLLKIRSTESPISNLQSPISPLAAFAGALAFEFSDLFIVHFGNLNMIAVAAWLPLIFLLFHLSLTRASLGLAATAGVVLAIATLAGHIQITLFILLTLGLYALYAAIINTQGALRYQLSMSKKEADDTTTHYALRTLQPTFSQFRPLLTLFLSLLITLLITIGLSALLLLPAYQMSQYTPRAELPYEEAARFSLHPAQMVGLFVPNYFGRDPALHWGPWERVETGYIGLMTLFLAAIGALLSADRLKVFFVGLGIVSLLLAMGGYSLVHGWLYATLPGFDQLRAPARFILLLDFSLAALAAFGLNALLQPLNDVKKARLLSLLKVFTWSVGGLIVVALPLSYFAVLITQDRNPAIFNRAVGAATGVALFAIFSIASLIVLHLVKRQWLQNTAAGIAIILVMGLDLFTLGANVDVGHSNPAAGFEHPAALAFLQNDPNLFRIEVTTDVWHAWQPNTAMLNNLYDAWGLYNPLTLADTTLYWSAAFPRSSRRYNFLGIKYIIAGKAGAPADGDIVPVFDADPQVNIYLNQKTLAPVQFVGQTKVVADHDAAWEAIFAAEFDPTQMVVLEGGQPLNSQPTSSLAILQHDLHAVTVAVETDQPGYLVLPEAYYPGWQATVDSQPEPIQRADYAFRAVYVPAGRHTAQFVFDPVVWKVGLGMSGGTLVILLIWVGWRYRRDR